MPGRYIAQSGPFCLGRPDDLTHDGIGAARFAQQERAYCACVWWSFPYGSRRMVEFLRHLGHVANRKRVQRLMRELELAGMAPGPATGVRHAQHKVYPYLLRSVAVAKPNHVWSTDVTYIRLARGFAYLVATIDWYSRKVLSWRISNSMDASFCVDGLEDALREHGRPEVFNSDQGSPFTSHAFTDVLQREGISISMDGRSRALDNIFVGRLWRNVKHEDVSLRGAPAWRS